MAPATLSRGRTRLNHGWTYTDRVPPEADGQTVLRFYASRYRHSSECEWRRRIEDGAVRLDGRRTAPDAALSAGGELTYHRSAWEEPDVPRCFAVLHRDAHVLAVAKPSGLPVLPGGNHLDNTLLACVRDHYPGADPVHRLGRGTSGIVLFARTSAAARGLSRDLDSRGVTKVYRALVAGTDMADTFRVDHPIGRVPYPDIGTLFAAAADGRPSRSDCRVLHRFPEPNHTLVEVLIHTGRPHQIRIHLAAAGHPLVGDPLYAAGGVPRLPEGDGRLPLPGDCGYFLHAHRVVFTHPESVDRVSVTCQPPRQLRAPGES